MNGLRRQVGVSVGAIRRAFANRSIRRLELAWALGIASQWALTVAFLVYAYEAGGSLGAGILGVARTVPALVGVPLASALGDRFDRARVLVAMYGGSFVTAGAAALCLALGAPLAVVLVLAAANAIGSAAARPLLNSLLPALARTPDELIAANVATSACEGTGTLVGPVLASAALGFGIGAAAGAGAVAVLAATLAAAAIHLESIAAPRPETLQSERAMTPGEVARPRPTGTTELARGLGALGRLPGPRLLVGLAGIQTLTRGLLNVFIVVASVELLGLGDPGVGLLSAAVGLGGLVGSVVATVLIGRPRLMPFVLGALLLWGLPISVVGLLPVPAVAVAMMVVVGTANAVMDVAFFSGLQRTVPNDVRSSVMGVAEGYFEAMVGLGGLLAPLLIAILGPAAALVAGGAILPTAVAASARRVLRVDDVTLVPVRRSELLRGVPMFEPLPITAVEELAALLRPTAFRAGEPLMTEGEAGDRFYVLDEGEAAVTQAGRLIRILGPGDFAGEIALLRHVRRTATVTARTDVLAFALDADAFIAAVSGDADAARAASLVVSSRLTTTATGSRGRDTDPEDDGWPPEPASEPPHPGIGPPKRESEPNEDVEPGLAR